MTQRVALILITLFWVCMNVLLWRVEYGQREATGGAVAPELVWQKILTAPDSSSLSIFHHRKKIGFCHWITNVGEELSKVKEEDASPEGMIGRVTEYRLQVEGNVAIPDSTARARFDGQLKLNTERLWQDLHLRLNLNPAVWEVRALAAQGTVLLRAEEDHSRFERVFKLTDLENPETLLSGLLGPMAYPWFRDLGLGNSLPRASSMRLGLNWEARHHSLEIAHTSVRAYRLQARVLDRYSIVIFVSRVGEILRIELPHEVVLVNDQVGRF